MLINDLKPKTIVGLKRLAKRRSREDGVCLSKALDLAAEQAGYSNYIEATRKILNARDNTGFDVRVIEWRLYILQTR